MKAGKICPYITATHSSQEVNSYAYDDGGAVTLHGHFQAESWEMMPCREEDCGAWIDGRCCYQGER